MKKRNLFNLNQIVRSAGIYIEKDKKENSLLSTIIPNQGSWITLKTNMRLKKLKSYKLLSIKYYVNIQLKFSNKRRKKVQIS